MQALVRLFAILLLSTVFSFTAHAQKGPPRTVTLREMLQRARDNPPSVLAALATLQRTLAQEQYARGAYIPRFSIEGGTGIGYSDQPILRISDLRQLEGRTPEEKKNYPVRMDAMSQNTFGRASVEYALLDVSRHFGVKSARLNASAQESAYAAAQRLAVQAASELYLRGVAALSLVEDARLTLERRSQQLEAIQGLVKAGLRPSVDATRAEIEAVAARYALETREIELTASGAALAAAMGSTPTEPILPAGFDDRVLPAPLGPLSASALATEQRPEIKQLETTLAARRAEHQSAIGARLPTAGIAGQGNLSYVDILGRGNGYEGRTLSGSASVYLRWAALDPAVWRRAKVTRVAVEEAQRQLEAALLSVQAEVVEAAYQVQRAHALHEQATQVLAAAQAARTAQNERYRAGVASLLDLLDAEGVEQNARRQSIEAARDQRVARVRLLAVCGQLALLAQ